MKTFILAATLLSASPVLAQNSLTTTQNPPAGGSSESTAQPTNSLPQASGTERPTQQPGSTVGDTRVTAPSNDARVIAPAAPPAR